MFFSFTDNHGSCEDWCKKKTNDEKSDEEGNRKKNIFKSLPRGKPLTDETLKVVLDEVINRYVKRASDLASLGSSQPNESMHQMVSSKAPKAM